MDVMHPPLRRHTTLQPFSREHMEGLVLARNLAEGRAGPREVRDAWESHLREHFRDEEELLLPLLGEPDRRRMLGEHKALRRMIGAVIARPSARRAGYTRLAALLHDHIRWEERALFESVQTTAGEALDRAAPRALEIQDRRPSARARVPGAQKGGPNHRPATPA